MPIAAAEGSPLPGPGGHLRAARSPRVTLYVQVRDPEGTVVMLVQQ